MLFFIPSDLFILFSLRSSKCSFNGAENKWETGPVSLKGHVSNIFGKSPTHFLKNSPRSKIDMKPQRKMFVIKIQHSLFLNVLHHYVMHVLDLSFLLYPSVCIWDDTYIMSICLNFRKEIQGLFNLTKMSACVYVYICTYIYEIFIFL